MGKVRVAGFSVSIDGFGAGPDQSLENPLGIGGMGLHEWAFSTDVFRKMHGGEGGSTGVDNDFAEESFRNLGAWILGRNMFAPSRGPWSDDGWRGWCGNDPPYHVPVFVLTHHPRQSITMNGGTIFHFVTGGIATALKMAREAAGEKDIRIGGGVSTIRQYLQAGLIDELHIAQSPVILGAGEQLFAGINLLSLGYHCTQSVVTEKATHIVLRRGKNE
jgi:dihydrofolate reductase